MMTKIFNNFKLTFPKKIFQNIPFHALKESIINSLAYTTQNGMKQVLSLAVTFTKF